MRTRPNGSRARPDATAPGSSGLELRIRGGCAPGSAGAQDDRQRGTRAGEQDPECAERDQEAAEASRGRPPGERLFAVGNAYRTWALANRPAFLLLYGTPVPGFEPPSGSAIGETAIRLATPFLEVVFDGWTPEQLAAVPVQPGAERLAAAPIDRVPLPVGALALFYELRAWMHGLVMLELLEMLTPINGYGEDLFRGMISRTAEELAALRAAA